MDIYTLWCFRQETNKVKFQAIGIKINLRKSPKRYH